MAVMYGVSDSDEMVLVCDKVSSCSNESQCESDDGLSLGNVIEQGRIRYLDDEVIDDNVPEEQDDEGLNELADIDDDLSGGLQAVGENREGGARQSFGEVDDSYSIALEAGGRGMCPNEVELSLEEAIVVNRIQIERADSDWDGYRANNECPK